MTSEGLDIAILGAKILEKVCEVPVLNVLKPVAGVLVIVCETAAVSISIRPPNSMEYSLLRTGYERKQ